MPDFQFHGPLVPSFPPNEELITPASVSAISPSGRRAVIAILSLMTTRPGFSGIFLGHVLTLWQRLITETDAPPPSFGRQRCGLPPSPALLWSSTRGRLAAGGADASFGAGPLSLAGI